MQEKQQKLQSSQVPLSKISINELITWKMSSLLNPITTVKFKSAFLHA